MANKVIGILGLGSIGSRHAKNFMNLGCKIVAWDPKYTALVKREDVFQCDAMVIATPTECHYNDLWDAILEKKHVLVEKPIASRSVHSLMYIRRPNVVIMVGNNLRFHQCVIQAKKWLDAGLIGKPQWAQFVVAQHNEKPDYLRDGVILNWGAHEVDLALHLLGPAEVKCASTDENETLADIIIKQKDCFTNIHLDYLTRPQQRWFKIVGDRATITCNLLSRVVTRIRLDDIIEASFIARDNWDENYIDEIKAFLDRIDGKETLGATAEEGTRCLNILLEAKRKIRL